MDIPRKLNASAWNDKFEQLKQYKSKYGDCNVPERYDKNHALGNWVRTQRTQFKQSKMSEERINMLNTIGFNWGVSIDKNSWNDKFEELKKYKSQHGDCNVPRKYDKNQQLARWVHHQRSKFKDSKMSEERINVLNAIGFNWGVSIDKKRWNDKFEELKKYKSKHGDCDVPYRYYEKNQPLATWVQTQRTQFKQLKLSEERINTLNTIGFNWGVSIDEKNWNDKFEQLKLYKSKHGHCNVPRKNDKNQQLATWVKNQRTQFKQSKMSEERINMLNTIGFNWGVSNDKSWNDKFEELKQYKSKHGDCNVPASYDKNHALGNWVRGQRTQFKQSKISKERINMLNTIGFNWGVSIDKKRWNDKFEELKKYKSKHGDCDVPYRYCLLYTSPSPRDMRRSRMPSSA